MVGAGHLANKCSFSHFLLPMEQSIRRENVFAVDETVTALLFSPV
jgi:hypothetical protein